jgi:hypothetical protein
MTSKKAIKEPSVTGKQTTPRVKAAKHRSAASAGSGTTPAAEPEVTRELVASVAYGYWESRGYEGGDPVEDWLRAEQELNRSL